MWGVNALTTFDDGSGQALYVAGGFKSAGGVALNSIAKWNGTSWSALGSGVNGGGVHALAVFDDGSGSALYAAGSFTSAGGIAASGIAKWNGKTWSGLGSGLNVTVNALAVFDDGSGPALYAGGAFSHVGGIEASRIAKWNGTSWSALGSGVNTDVHALTVFDDGGGPALHAGGEFTSAGGLAANRIAKWDGVSWSPLGIGMNGDVAALTVFDDGGGPELYAGGWFTGAGGITASRIAKWDGVGWSGVGSGVDGGVVALTVYDDGSGSALYVGGYFTTTDGVAVSRIGKWNGVSWSALESGVSEALVMTSVYVSCLGVFDGGSGPTLCVGGVFVMAGSVPATGIAKWNGTSWSAFGKGVNYHVNALAVFDDGGGPALYAGGVFTAAGGVVTNGVAKWDGTSWSALGSGVSGAPFDLSNVVSALAVFDDGSGPALYAGGYFLTAGGVAASYIAKWNGSGWSGVGEGVGGGIFSTQVTALAVFDDGSGPALYVGGDFTTTGGGPANSIARWNGIGWSALGSGIGGGGIPGLPAVNALAVFDDGSGPAIYAAGNFTSAGGVAASRIARWDGTSWSALGTGISGCFMDQCSVAALTVFDDGSGPALYAGGFFGMAGGIPANCIAKWNGESWSALGGGVGGDVRALTVFDDGGGEALYAAGSFSSAGGVDASGIAKWDGTSWSAVGSGLLGVQALAVWDDGSGAALIAAGDFNVSPAGDSYVAKWGCPAPISSIPGCTGNPATLAALSDGAPLGAELPLKVTGSAATTGVAVVYFGAPGVDGSGCGLLVPGLGELLLALVPAPKLVTSGVLAAGTCDLSPVVPSLPSLRGLITYLQGAAVHLPAPSAIEITNALSVRLGP